MIIGRRKPTVEFQNKFKLNSDFERVKNSVMLRGRAGNKRVSSSHRQTNRFSNYCDPCTDYLNSPMFHSLHTRGGRYSNYSNYSTYWPQQSDKTITLRPSTASKRNSGKTACRVLWADLGGVKFTTRSLNGYSFWSYCNLTSFCQLASCLPIEESNCECVWHVATVTQADVMNLLQEIRMQTKVIIKKVTLCYVKPWLAKYIIHCTLYCLSLELMHPDRTFISLEKSFCISTVLFKQRWRLFKTWNWNTKYALMQCCMWWFRKNAHDSSVGNNQYVQYRIEKPLMVYTGNLTFYWFE